MSEKKKKNRKAIAIGIVGLSSIIGVATVGLIIGLSASKTPNAVNAGDKTSAKNIDWAKIAIAPLSIKGAGAELKNGLLTISGDAPSANARKEAFEKSKNAVLAALSHENSEAVTAFANAITINGEKIDELPDALSTLDENPQAQSCQNAYNTLLDGRVINFNSGSAIIADESKALLDGLSSVATRCVTYNVEVGGHTDGEGDEFANQSLSERRAQAVADYLVGKGINASNLIVKGYGETRPIDTSGTNEGDAKNRRIEFKVTQKV